MLSVPAGERELEGQRAVGALVFAVPALEEGGRADLERHGCPLYVALQGLREQGDA